MVVVSNSLLGTQNSNLEMPELAMRTEALRLDEILEVKILSTGKTFKSGGLVAKLCPTLVILGTIACENPLSVEFSRQEYWSGLPFPFPGDPVNPGIEPRSPALQADSLPTELCSICLLLPLLLSRFSRVRLCATPETAAHQAPWSLGFSRQEHWSGLPFPSPLHESEK